jgi:SAM-dependent methyltransferase
MLDAAGWDRRYTEQESVFPPEPNPFVVELASQLTPGRAIDLAAGEGRNSLWLAERGWRVTAVDFSRVGLEKARQRADEAGVEMEYVQANLYDYVPQPRAFDLVLIAYMHPKPRMRRTVFGRAADAVAPGGHVLVLGRDLADLPAGLGPSDPTRRFTTRRLSGAFPGIELERCEQVTRTRTAVDGERELIDTLAWGTRRAR